MLLSMNPVTSVESCYFRLMKLFNFHFRNHPEFYVQSFLLQLPEYTAEVIPQTCNKAVTMLTDNI